MFRQPVSEQDSTSGRNSVTRVRVQTALLPTLAYDQRNRARHRGNIRLEEHVSPGRCPKHSRFLKRFGKLSCMLNEDGNENICFVHNHEIIRVTKVFVNTYHLWPKWVNNVLKFCKLGGGFHSAIEILGQEYHFGGCVKQDGGIFESVPFYSLQKPKETGSPTHRQDLDRDVDMAAQVGRLKDRKVIGLWAGGKADIDIFLRHLKETRDWKGTKYKTLSSNCNHFVRSACEVLLKESGLFYPAKGIISVDNMAPPHLFKLSNFLKSNCFGPVTRFLDEDLDIMDSGELYAFKGRPKTIAATSAPTEPTKEEARNHGRDRAPRRSLPSQLQETPFSGSCPSGPSLREHSIDAVETRNRRQSAGSRKSSLKSRSSRASSKNSFGRPSRRSSNISIQSTSHKESLSGPTSNVQEGRSSLPRRLEDFDVTHANKENNSGKQRSNAIGEWTCRTHNPLVPVSKKGKRLSASARTVSLDKPRAFTIEDIDEVLTRRRGVCNMIASGTV